MLVNKNIMYMNRKIAPSRHAIFSLDKKYHKKLVATNEKIISSEKASISTRKGAAINIMPKINVIFIKQLPTILPNARSACPFLTEPILVTNSGRLVPIATMVPPITICGIPTLKAMVEAVSTIK